MRHRTVLRRLITAAASIAAFAGGANAAQAKTHHAPPIRRITAQQSPHAHPTPGFLAGAAVERAARYYHGLPCDVTLQPAGAAPGDPTTLPAGWGMGRQGCAIYYDAASWRQPFAWLSRTPGDPYAVDSWQQFCVDVIGEVGAMAGHEPPSTGAVYGELRVFCGTRA